MFFFSDITDDDTHSNQSANITSPQKNQTVIIVSIFIKNLLPILKTKISILWKNLLSLM